MGRRRKKNMYRILLRKALGKHPFTKKYNIHVNLRRLGCEIGGESNRLRS
jgi:hypothetical protein